MKISQALLVTIGSILGTANAETICLKQADFDKGTKIIDTPGYYQLCENISFRPNYDGGDTDLDDMETIFDPDFDEYSPNHYGLGFFAAIAVQANGVTIDLNGFKLEQSAEHALMQRFFALIELANSPFIQSVGPAQFVGASETFSPASDFVLKGPGTLGRSAHHGVHGNENTNVHIYGVTFEDFEVAAVSLNKVSKLTINECVVTRNRKDVPIVGLFSAARFIRPYLKKLTELPASYSMHLRGVSTDADTLYKNLLTAIKNVFDDVSTSDFINPSTHPEEHQLFDNPKRVVDGPCYAFLVHGRGPAVAGFADTRSQDLDVLSTDVFIEDNDIRDIHCWNNEVPAALEDSRPVNDVRGAVFQFFKTFGPDSEKNLAAAPVDGGYMYVGNAVADAQIMVAKAVLDGVLTATPEMQTVPNSINTNIINWAMSENDVYSPKFRCNGDSMHHVMKGIAIVRVDDCLGFTVQNNHISNVENLSEQPFTDCHDYHTTSSENVDIPQQAGNVRVISAAAVGGYVPGVDGKFSKMAGVPKGPKNGPPQAGGSILPNWDFEDGSINPWVPHWDQASVELVYDSERDSNVGKAYNRDRSQHWQGIAQDVTDIVQLEQDYIVTIWAKLMGVADHVRDELWFTMEVLYSDADTDWITLNWTNELTNQWKKLGGYFKGFQPAGTVTKINVYAGGPTGHDFAIDDAMILPPPTALSSLLTNGDFEDGTIDPWHAHWNDAAVDLVFDNDTGSNVGKSYNRHPHKWWEGIAQDVTGLMEAGEEYFIKVKAKLMGVDDHVTDYFSLTLEVSYANGDMQWYNLVWINELTNQWQTDGDYFVFEPAKGNIKKLVVFAEGPYGHDFAIDDVVVMPMSSAAPPANPAPTPAPENPPTPAPENPAPACPIHTLDFSTLGNGDWLRDELFESDCVKVTAITNEWENRAKKRGFTPVDGKHNPLGGAARVFDTGNKQNCDSDLMTPSPKFFNGPNKGCRNCCGGGPYLMDYNKHTRQCDLRGGKQTPNAFKNDQYRGNVVLIQEFQGDDDEDEMEDCPDDTYVGGIIAFAFCQPVTVKAIGLLDVDGKESAKIIFHYGGGNEKTVDLDPTGDNGYWKYDFDEPDVVEVQVKYSGSGAVESLEYAKCDGTVGRALGESDTAHSQLRGQRQLQDPEVDSIISYNEIYDIFSKPEGPCIGIDVQGISEQIELAHNIVDLDPTVRGNGNGKHIGIRFRSKVKKDKVKKDKTNTLPQGYKEEEASFGGQSIVISPDGHPDITEWELGQAPGCPFANR